MKKDLPTLLQEAERAFDEKFAEDLYEGESLKIKSHFRETILSILSEAERATEIKEKDGDKLGVYAMTEAGQGAVIYVKAFNHALSQVKSLWREWRGNLK